MKPQTGVGSIMQEVLSGRLTLSHAQQSVFFGQMESRLKPLAHLEEYLDSNEIIFRCSSVTARLGCSYSVLGLYALGQTIFLRFLSGIRQIIVHFPCYSRCFFLRLFVLLSDDELQGDSNSIVNQELICKGWFLPSNTYDCGSFVVN